MRVAIDDSALHSGHAGRGIGVYARELIHHLQERVDIELKTFSDKGDVPQGVDVVHFPAFDLFQFTLPIFCSVPVVVTIHDLIPIVYEEHFPRGLRGTIVWNIQKALAGQVKRIVTDSEASKQDIARLIGIDDARIDVVRLAPVPFTAGRKSDESDLRAYGITGEYILYVGDLNWNKNVSGLLEGYRLSGLQKKGVKLVLAGSAFVQDTLPEAQEVRRAVARHGLAAFVVFSGRIQDVDMNALYRSALVLVQPSFAEGFGLPVLEAMSAGCPVMVSNTPSLLEIAGPASVVQSDGQSIAKGLQEVFSFSKVKRKNVIQSGFRWSSGFTWKKVADEMMTVYRNASGF